MAAPIVPAPITLFFLYPGIHGQQLSRSRDFNVITEIAERRDASQDKGEKMAKGRAEEGFLLHQEACRGDDFHAPLAYRG